VPAPGRVLWGLSLLPPLQRRPSLAKLEDECHLAGWTAAACWTALDPALEIGRRHQQACPPEPFAARNRPWHAPPLVNRDPPLIPGRAGLGIAEPSLSPRPRLSQVLADVMGEEPARGRQRGRTVQPDVGPRQRRKAMLAPERYKRSRQRPGFHDRDSQALIGDRLDCGEAVADERKPPLAARTIKGIQSPLPE
jgi:hypothetical protein